MEKSVFSGCGGCTAKLGAAELHAVLQGLPKLEDNNLLVGFNGSDDAAVYRLTDDIAIIQTLDFFPPVVDDPYVFGEIAAANALSDIYAMGGDVLLALNIVAFDDKLPMSMLSDMLKGGAIKVAEAGGLLCGGHTIVDKAPKYGLSVTGICRPDKILRNDNPRIGDALILTKALGVGIITTAQKLGEADEDAFTAACDSMRRLNRFASETVRGYRVHACTDVTGFGFAGHLMEMLGGENGAFSAVIDIDNLPRLPKALEYAREFFITAAGQRNRNHAKGLTNVDQLDFAMQELVFDPQTSGGLLVSLHPEDAENALKKLQEGCGARIVGHIEKRDSLAISFGS